MIQLLIKCDDCGRRSLMTGHPTKKPAHILRRELELQGWINGGKFDYCPECYARRKVNPLGLPGPIVTDGGR